jgi:predicted nucleotidyltransferase
VRASSQALQESPKTKRDIGLSQIPIILYLRNQMKTKDQILLFLSKNKGVLRDRFHVVKIGLFGSYARGEQHSKSDIDLIVEFEENTQELFELKIQLKNFIKDNLGTEVDICREKYIKPRIRKSILKETVYVD